MSKTRKTKQIPDEISTMSFEEAYAALKDATERLEGEEIDLESTLDEYSRASALAQHCANLLDSAEKRVSVLTESEGVIQLTSLDTEETD